MKLLVVASVLVLTVYGSKSISSHDERYPALVFYINKYVEDEDKELREQYRRMNREEEERQRSTTQSGKIYKLDHKKPYRIPQDFIRFAIDRPECVVNTCTYICEALDYRISYCESSTVCYCAKFSCLNCDLVDNNDLDEYEYNVTTTENQLDENGNYVTGENEIGDENNVTSTKIPKI